MSTVNVDSHVRPNSNKARLTKVFQMKAICVIVSDIMKAAR